MIIKRNKFTVTLFNSRIVTKWGESTLLSALLFPMVVKINLLKFETSTLVPLLLEHLFCFGFWLYFFSSQLFDRLSLFSCRKSKINIVIHVVNSAVFNNSTYFKHRYVRVVGSIYSVRIKNTLNHSLIWVVLFNTNCPAQFTPKQAQKLKYWETVLNFQTNLYFSPLTLHPPIGFLIKYIINVML